MYDNKVIQVEATGYVDDIKEINPFGRISWVIHTIKLFER
jgi:hypothetical protein